MYSKSYKFGTRGGKSIFAPLNIWSNIFQRNESAMIISDKPCLLLTAGRVKISECNSTNKCHHLAKCSPTHPLALRIRMHHIGELWMCCQCMGAGKEAHSGGQGHSEQPPHEFPITTHVILTWYMHVFITHRTHISHLRIDGMHV